MKSFYLTENYEVLIYGLNCISQRKLADVLLAERALRELTWQPCPFIESYKAQSNKATAIESTRAQLEKANQQLKNAQLQYPRKEYALYRAERRGLKEVYDSLRRDPKWFMREELVQDCSDRGGCCSRDCGCCAQRHL
ncbi:hypothetical protein N7517_003599 [Penicillium concentricum]|uniref:Uncharacterized protein n=1 Tax=Penicillium concentricum TaxID=293559 RepID=A0A9W9S8J8_9EURO|nr:uncharacterized protein N7517_003599 [Penicillium concentricum]KAJ5371593.1 hypothetical protein N7517_003599 [Penicillium concentricum]